MKFPLLTRNFGLKAFSFGVAMVMFLFVSLESTTPQGVEFELKCLEPKGLIIVNEAPRVIRATLQGPLANLRTWKSDDLKPVEVDLAGKDIGKHTIKLELEDIEAPAGMDVISIFPNTLEIELDQYVTREFRVKADPEVVAASPVPGFTTDRFSVEPRTVFVRGPYSELNKFKENDVDGFPLINVRGIDLSEYDSDFTGEVQIKPPSGIRKVEIEPDVVTFNITIVEEMVQRTFSKVRVRLENGQPGMTVEPDTVPVTLNGPRLFVDKLKPNAVDVFVDAGPELEEGLSRFEKPVELAIKSEKTSLVEPVPTVVVEMPRGRKRRRR